MNELSSSRGSSARHVGADGLWHGLCSAGVQQQFAVMRDALNKTGRPIVYAIDDWGVTNPWQYGMGVRHLLPDLTTSAEWLLALQTFTPLSDIDKLQLKHTWVLVRLPAVTEDIGWLDGVC